MNAKQLGDYLAERINRTDPKFLDKLTAYETIQLGILQNMLGMLGVIAEQNNVLLNHLCPPKEKSGN